MSIIDNEGQGIHFAVKKIKIFLEEILKTQTA